MVSGAWIIVWPSRARPYASSACWMCHVSWKPLTNVPCWAESRPSSGLPRMPRYPLATANWVSDTPRGEALGLVSTQRHGSAGWVERLISGTSRWLRRFTP